MSFPEFENINLSEIYKHCGGLCIFPIILGHTMSQPPADCQPSGSMSSKFNLNVADEQIA